MLHFLFIVHILFSNLAATPLQKPNVYKEGINVKNWYMSEKLDGIRAYWDGKNLRTKNGKKIYTPSEFTDNFPNFELDGELWTKRDDFENIQNIVLDKTPSKKWEEITYNIFEVPNAKGNFLQRVQKAKNWFEKHPNKNIKFIKQKRCKNKEHLNIFLKELVAKKAEGVIIKNGKAPYFYGRSSNILKVKKFFDMEGVVVDINKKENRMKSLVVKLKNEIVFNLGGGFSNRQRIKHPKVGDIVTFKYYGFTKYGKPKFASFLRVRKRE